LADASKKNAPGMFKKLDEFMISDAKVDPKLPVNYVFVDYENVHEVDLALFNNKTVYLTLLMGPRQSRLDVELVEKLVEHAATVQLVRLNSAGNNALDFALAYYLGKAANADPTAYFHIVSKDAGFDSLIEHLGSRRIRVRRHEDYASLTFSKPVEATTAAPEDLLTRVLTHLREHPKNRPKSKKTLASHVAGICGKGRSWTGANELIDRLCKAGHVTIGEKDVVTYHQLDPK
jgi:hypothetical protein